MQRLDWEQMQDYWQRHAADRARVDWRHDPDGFANVCFVNAPLWLNRQHAQLQREVYLRLLSATPREGAALDIGCGTGRWSRLLRDAGVSVTGIDLQPSLIERNKREMPDIAFVTGAIQELELGRQVDLVSSVTVLQHIPFAEQELAIARIRALSTPRASVLVLENVADQSPHVFSRTAGGWVDLFARHGFSLTAQRPYDYSVAVRALQAAEDSVRTLLRRGRHVGSPPSDLASYNRRDEESGLRRFLQAVRWVPRRVAHTVDFRLGMLLLRRSPSLEATHCGFLFHKTR